MWLNFYFNRQRLSAQKSLQLKWYTIFLANLNGLYNLIYLSIHSIFLPIQLTSSLTALDLDALVGKSEH